MGTMYEVIGTSTPAYLLADPQGADVIAVPVEPGNGKIARGALLYRKSNGMYAPAGTSQISTSYNLVVLNEDIDTGTAVGANTVAEDAAAFRGGRFIDGKVTYDDSGTATKVTAAHKLVLRLFGILFDVDENAAEFDNGTYTITYSANNGLTGDSAEPDVVKAKLAGATYTILNNSDSSLSFTAPATKSFSKWNTKADGSGTDYAAAATYSTDADLKLYAVWA